MLHIAAAAALVGGITDYSTHPLPELTLPGAGGTYVDPVFGTTILRVTDSRHGQRCVNAYSYWPALNVDATRLLVACDDVPLVFRFDPSTLAASMDRPLRDADAPRIQFEGATWSDVDPDVIYGLEGTRLWMFDLASGEETLLREFVDVFPYPFVATQLHMSADDRAFTWHSRSPTGAKLDAVVWDRESGEVFVFDRGAWAIDETKISKGGRWVMVNGADGETRLWEVRTGFVDRLEWGDPDDKPGGHADLGHDRYVNSDGWDTGLIVRRFDAPHGAGISNVVQYLRPDGTKNWSIADHVSMRADDESFVIGSTYGGDGQWHAFEDEIFLARLDGSGFVRLAHTRSTAGEYWAFPRAVVDRSGRFVVWTSDLGSPDRIDVLLMTMPWEEEPPAPGADAGISLEDAGASPDATGASVGGKVSSGCVVAAARADGSGRWIGLIGLVFFVVSHLRRR